MIDAAREKRSFTAEDLHRHEQAIALARANLGEAQGAATADEAVRARSLHDKRPMDRYGLLFDDGMIAGTDTLAGDTPYARPTLIVDDKGIAKTQLAKFATSLFRCGPLVVSAKSDLMSDELIR